MAVRNEGRASAVAPYIRIEFTQPFAIGPLGVSSQQTGAPLQIVTEAVQPPASTVIGRADFYIHPKAPFQIAQISATIRGDQAVPPCNIKYAAGSLKAAIVEDTLSIAPSEIAEVLGRPVQPTER